MDILKVKLNATTLAEALIAMVVILLSFGIAVTIFANVTASSRLHEKTRAEILIQEAAVKTKSDKNMLDGEMEYAGIKIQKKVSQYQGVKGLSVLSLNAFDRNDKKIAEYNELLFLE